MTPAFIVCLAFSGVLVVSEALLPGRPELGAVALLLVAPALGLAVFLRPLLLAIAIAAALAGLARAELPPADPGLAARAAAMAGRQVTLRGSAVDDPRPTGGGYELLLAPDQPVYGSVLVRVRGESRVAFGDRVEARGRLRLPQERPGFDRRAYLAQRHAYLELPVPGLTVLAPAPFPAGVPSKLRAAYRQAVEELVPRPHSAVLLGVVLGIRNGVPARLQQDLVATGLVHLLVLSGLKVAVFARLASAALTPLLGGWSTIPVVAMIAGYALAGGATPAAVRAAAMGGLALVGARLGRSAHVWTSLGLVGAAMIAWSPEVAWDVGFELSFLGTAAIVLLTPAIERRLTWLPHLLREPFAVTCAAQVGTLPITAQGFHVISPVAPIANALVLPLLPAMVGAGLLLAPLALMPAAGSIVALPLVGLLAYLEQVAGLLAKPPGAALPIAGFPPWAGLAYYAGLSGLLGAVRSRGSLRVLAVLLAVAGPLAVAGVELLAWERSLPLAVVLDVGDGQALLVSGPAGQFLVDGGPSPARLADGLGQHLAPWRRDLDGLVITAPGLGHTGGLSGLDRKVGLVVLPAGDLPGTAWRGAALGAVAGGARLTRLGAGAELKLAGMRLQALSKAGDPLALRIVSPDGRAFCDMSELDPEAEVEAATRLRGRCDYLLLPAGGRTAPAQELLDRARPRELIVSAAAARLARGIPPGAVRRTDQEGAIELSL